MATLPWVESDSIVADKTTLKAKFKIKDAKQFDEKAVQEVLKNKGYDGAKKVSAPKA